MLWLGGVVILRLCLVSRVAATGLKLHREPLLSIVTHPVDYLQRVDLIQVLRFETATRRIKVKVYELREVSLKFERHLLSEIINFEVPFPCVF